MEEQLQRKRRSDSAFFLLFAFCSLKKTKKTHLHSSYTLSLSLLICFVFPEMELEKGQSLPEVQRGAEKKKRGRSKRETRTDRDSIGDGERKNSTSSSTTSKQTPSTQQLSSRVVGTDEPIIAVMRSVVAEASSSNSNGSPVASLAQGAVWWQPPPVALKAAADAALNDSALSSAYGDDMGLPELRAALLRKCERDHGLESRKHAAMVSAGANLAVSALALALLDSSPSSDSSSSSSASRSSNEATKKKRNRNRKDAAVLFPPYYFNAKMAVQLAGAEVVLGQSDEGTWLPDVEWLEGRLREEDEEEEKEEAEGDIKNSSLLLSRIRMVYLVNPGNPSGVVVPYELVQRLVEVCSGKKRKSKRAVFLVLDSTYEAFAPPPSTLTPASSSSASTPSPGPPFPLPSGPHVIHVGSFSKAFGAAGWRAGYIIYPLVRRARHEGESAKEGDGRSEEENGDTSVVIDLLGPQLLKIQDTLPIHAAIASQRLALACLEGTKTGTGEGGGQEKEEGESESSSFGRAWVSEKVAGLSSSKKAAEAALGNLGSESRLWGEGAIYLWARLPPRTLLTTTEGEEGGSEAASAAADDREFVRFCVSQHGVAVIPGSACGVPGCVRVAYGKPRPGPEFEEAAARLGRACKAWVERK